MDVLVSALFPLTRVVTRSNSKNSIFVISDIDYLMWQKVAKTCLWTDSNLAVRPLGFEAERLNHYTKTADSSYASKRRL